MTRPYGVDPQHPAADLLVATLRERYGPIGRLERERFRLVDVRDHTGPPPITPEQGDVNAHQLAVELERHDRDQQVA